MVGFYMDSVYTMSGRDFLDGFGILGRYFQDC